MGVGCFCLDPVLGVGSKENQSVTQALVHVSTYQGSILVPVLRATAFWLNNSQVGWKPQGENSKNHVASPPLPLFKDTGGFTGWFTG